MNLLLYLNNFGFSEDGKPVTMVMATHNPDIEIYADRILYIQDGQIMRQVINSIQHPIDFETYNQYLKDLRKKK